LYIWKYFGLNIRADTSCFLPSNCFSLLRLCTPSFSLARAAKVGF